MSQAEALRPAQWVALHRLLQLLQYMLKHYEAVPAHLPQQLNQQLLAPKAEASPPFAIVASSASATSSQAPALAKAAVSFEPASSGDTSSGGESGSSSSAPSSAKPWSPGEGSSSGVLAKSSEPASHWPSSSRSS